MLRESRREAQEMRGVHDKILIRLETLDLKYPDLMDMAEDLRYLHNFCEQFWAKPKPEYWPETVGTPLPKSATDILPNVPAEKRSKFWQFVEKLMELVGKDRRA